MENNQTNPAPPNKPGNSNQAVPKKLVINLFFYPLIVLFYEWLTVNSGDFTVQSIFWVVVFIEAGLFVPLGFWAKTKPYYATLAGMAVIIIFSFIFFGIEGNDFVNIGVLIRLMALGGLYYNLSSFKKPGSANKTGG